MIFNGFLVKNLQVGLMSLQLRDSSGFTPDSILISLGKNPRGNHYGRKGRLINF
jgi:phage protein D